MLCNCSHPANLHRQECNTEATCKVLKIRGPSGQSDDETSRNPEFSRVGRNGVDQHLGAKFFFFRTLGMAREVQLLRAWRRGEKDD
jgi:hypothetical protein